MELQKYFQSAQKSASERALRGDNVAIPGTTGRPADNDTSQDKVAEITGNHSGEDDVVALPAMNIAASMKTSR